MAKLLMVLFSFQVPLVFAQSTTQVVRGTVLDKVTQQPIQGANIILLNSNPFNGAVSDEKGNFILKNVQLGRQAIRISYLGYQELVLSNLIVNASKEVVLQVQLTEEVVQANEVVVKAVKDKQQPVNTLALVSARSFSLEETQKYAASVNDPARMATSFAGVVQGDDGGNMISIRGNSPYSMLWRMEGVDIPNPNHFSGVGTSGGGISILSSQLMNNSDFMTGAFTSDYGNALSGVFDIRLRKGNNQKQEYTIQAGLLGLDVATEGPFKKGYDGSYLVNYRYSTLSLLGMTGLQIGFGVTTFQDLSFNISLPAGKAGQFGWFGMGGFSSQRIAAEKDSLKWREEPLYRYNSIFKANTGVSGFHHTFMLNKNTTLRSVLVLSGTENAYSGDMLNSDYSITPQRDESFINSRLSFSSTITHRFSSRNSLKAGIVLSQLHFSLQQQAWQDSLLRMQTEISGKGSTWLVQSFVNWNHRVNDRLSWNAGIHLMQLSLNRTGSIEPRFSARYVLNNQQTLAAGYGLHAQVQPIGVYFVQDSLGNYINRDLDFNKAHHFVLSYDYQWSAHTHIKTEVYYQHLFHLPVGTVAGSTFALINQPQGYTNEGLTGAGKGKNYGVELTVERFLHRNFYYLVSASVNNSIYQNLEGRWFSTMYNTGHAGSITAGKEWQLSEKRKKKILGVNLKVLYAGGLRYTPIDLPESIRQGETRYVDSKAFTLQNPSYFRPDIRISIKRNFKKSTGTLALDIQNVINRQNVGGQYYDINTGNIKYWYQQGIIPILSYRIEF